MKRLLVLFTMLALLGACNSHTEITTDPLPTITLGDQGNYHTIKVGQSLTLSPSTTYGQSYQWSMDGVTLATTPSYTFTPASEGTFYLTFRVTNQAGSSEEDIRIDVEALQPPLLSFATAEDGVLTIAIGESTIEPNVVYGQGAQYEWSLDGEIVATTHTCTLSMASAGEHSLSLRVTNADGSTTESVTLRVVEHLAGEILIPLYVATPLGRTLYLDAVPCNFSSPTYRWQVNGVESTDPIFAFTPTSEGTYNVTLTLSDADGYSLSRNVEVEVTPAEDTYRRTATASSQSLCNKVYEYRPAAGQFINESQSGFAAEQSAAAATAYAERRLAEGKYLSLGAWGGYVVVGFDHSIASGEGYDFSITGNQHEGSSEAGIVWVMQDSNGNGLPDDVWYELRGSEWGSATYQRGYAITYYRPAYDKMNIQWHDNRGKSGFITRNSTHTQPSYYPAWEGSTFTLYGSLLEPNTEVDAATGNQINNAYEWGYADNQGTDSTTVPSGVKNYFKISSAVAADGSAANLQYIDFVKVQSAINFVAGALGEISTEMLSIEDENM